MLRVSLCGGVVVEADGRPLPDALLAGRQGRLVLAYLVCERHRAVPRDELADLLWGEDLPPSWPASLSAVISKLRRLLGEAGLDSSAALASAFGSYQLNLPGDAWIDLDTAFGALDVAEQTLRAGDVPAALAAAAHAEEIARRGFLTDDCRWVDDQRARLHDVVVRVVQVRAEVHLQSSDRNRAVEAAREVVALDPVRESGYRLLMRALAAAGERGEALRVWEQCRSILVDELGTDPAPETEAIYLEILRDQATPDSLPSGVVTFLLTDIVGSSGLWERQPTAMATALARHDALITETARAHGGQLLKAKLEGDATVSVFPRATSGALAALAMRDALAAEPWPEGAAPQVRMALHTGEAFERDGDFFGPALNRAARLRSLAAGGQILVSQALAELVRDHLPEGTALLSLGHRELRGLSRGEHVYELASGRDPIGEDAVAGAVLDALVPPPVPAALLPIGPFVGRDPELARLAAEWDRALAGTTRVVMIGGEPGVGKTRLAAERSRAVHDGGGIVLYGRCDEELGAPYQPFAEALRTLLPSVGAARLSGVRGIEELVRLVPQLSDLVADLSAPTHGDPDSERYVLFDAVARLLVAVSAEAPILIVLDDLHWANKPTLLMLRHVLRFGERGRIQLMGTYRTTDLDPAHPLAATLGDLHRDGTAERLVLSGLADDDVAAYVEAAGYDDEELGRTLASVTSGNPFFLIEVLRHVDESGGRWDPGTLPQGVREAVGRRLAHLTPEANEALLAGAVVGARFALDLVERVVGRDLVDPVSEACDAGIVVEEPGGWFRFNHAIVRRSLLAAVASVKRVRLHQRIAEYLEASVGENDDEGLADLAHHYFESAWAGNAAKAVEYCRRAAEQAMERLAFEAAADLYERAVQALDIEDASARAGERAELLLSRCEALLAAGDATAATEAVGQLEEAARGSARLAAWATCFTGQLAVLSHPDQLDTIEGAVAAAAEQLAELEDTAGEAKANTVRASCLFRLGRAADCEATLDRALTAARRGGDRGRVNAVLALLPVAALWGPHPVPRAGGRCLDVIRLLRITTGSPAVEATSVRCQAVLEAFRGRAPAARRMLDNARRTLTDLALRHALLEVDLFAGIVELVADDATAAEPHLRRAYQGFRRMGVDADAAHAAALLARACLVLGRADEADELCAESERLSGHDLKASIAWRAVRAQLLAARGEYAEARHLAEAAVALAERTDAVVDHGDAWLALAGVLDAAGDRAGARTAAERAAALYERKGAAALVERARSLVVGVDAGVSKSPEAVPPSKDTVPDTASRALVEAFDLFARRDWVGLRAVFPAPIWFDDRRRVLGSEGALLDILPVFESLADLGATDIAFTVAASRGERLVLGLQEMMGEDDYEVVNLLLAGLDSTGRLDLAVLFDPEDRDRAFAELEARYLAGEGAPHAAVWERIVSVFAQLNRGEPLDPPPGFEYVDHRDFPLVDADLRLALDTLRGAASDVRWTITAVHALEGDGAVVSVEIDASNSDGTEARWSNVDVFIVRDGQVLRAEIYPGDQLDAALARFRELRSVSTFDNAATRTTAAVAASLARGDGSAALALFSESASLDDRRRVVGSTGSIVDLAHVVQNQLDHGWGFEFRPVATRGQRLGLFRQIIKGGDGYENPTLVVVGTDDDQKVLLTIVFEPEDDDAAFAELDARYLAGEAAPFADTYLALTRGIDAYNARDNERAPVAPDVVLVDHRPASAARFEGRDALVSYLQPMLDQSTMTMRITQVHDLDEGGVLSTLLDTGTSADGGSIELSFHAIHLVDNGVVTRIEVFPETALDEALARFGERRPGSTLRNRCTAALDRFAAAFEARDWDVIGAFMTPDVVSEWRGRLALYGPRLLGRDGLLEWVRSTADIGVARHEITPIATRGDRLALVHMRSVGSGPDAPFGAFLFVFGVDDDGLVESLVGDDPEDLDAAFAELDARYLAGEAVRFADTYRAVARLIGAFNARELERAPLAPDVVIADRRPARMGDFAGRDAVISYMQAVSFDDTWLSDMTMRVTAVHALDEGGVLSTIMGGGASADGAAFDVSFHCVAVVDDSIVTRFEVFAANDVERARARFSELRRPSSIVGNAASAAESAILTEALARRDWDAIGAMVADDVVSDDRHPSLRHITAGREEYVDAMKGVAAIGVTDVEPTVIATRGHLLSLSHTRWGGTRRDFYVVEDLIITEVGADGRVTASVYFDHEAVDDAFAELDARYLTGEGAPYADTLAPMSEFLAAYNAQDWPRCRAVLCHDFSMVDRRPASLGTISGPDGFLQALQPLLDLAPSLAVRASAIHALDHNGAVFQLDMATSTGDGSDIELGFHVSFRVSDRKLSHWEFFAQDQLESALAAFHRFGEPELPLTIPENAAERARTAVRGLMLRQDWDALGARIGDDFVLDDRRAGVRNISYGRGQFIEVMKSVASVGVTDVESTVLATRGDRLSLSRTRWAGKDRRPGAFETEILVVSEVDTDGRVKAYVDFDLDALDAALAELDLRYLAGEGAPYAGTLAPMIELLAAYNGPDWPGFRSRLADGFTVVDHRPAPALYADIDGPDGFIDALRRLFDLASGVRVRIRSVPAVGHGSAVVQLMTTAATSEGGAIELAFLLGYKARAGMIASLEFFSDAQLDAALASFRAEVATTADDPIADIFARRDWRALRESLADDFVFDDRRSSIRSGPHGPDEFVELIKGMADVGPTAMAPTVVATRGDRLILRRVRWALEDPRPDAFEIDHYVVCETDADGLAKAYVDFDADDLQGAYAELCERYLAGEGAPFAAVLDVTESVSTAFNARDWDGVAAAHTEDVVVVDHHPANWGTFQGRDRMVAILRGLVDVQPDATLLIPHRVGLADYGSVARVAILGHSESDMTIERSFLIVQTVADGRITRREAFPDDQLDVALARFEELGTSRNAAGRFMDAFARAFGVRDWDAAGALLADDFVLDDRRIGVRDAPRRGREAAIDSQRSIAEIGATAVDCDVVAARGEQLALVRMAFRGADANPDAFRYDNWEVVGTDSMGRSTFGVVFDADSIGPAYAELCDRYLDGEGAPFAGVLRVVERVPAAFNARAWSDLEDVFAADFEVVDHRPFWGHLRGANRGVPILRGIVDLQPDAVFLVTERPAIAGHGSVARVRIIGGDEGVDVIEQSFVAVEAVADGRLARLEIFADDELDAALARFEELRPTGRQFDNAAVRFTERWAKLFACGDPAQLAALVAPGAVFQDRRAGLRTEAMGVDAAAQVMAMMGIGVERIEATPIAIRGDTLGLFTVRFSGRDTSPDAYEARLLVIHEIDEQGLVTRALLFDESDIGDACAEFEALHMAGEAAPVAGVLRVVQRVPAAFNARAWSDLEDVFSADFEVVDHRPFWGHLRGANRGVPVLRGIVDLQPDAVFLVTERPAIAAHGSVARISFVGGEEGVDVIEQSHVAVEAVADGHLTRLEIFPDDELDAALARFEEMRPAPRQLDNSAVRATEQWTGLVAGGDAERFADLIAPDAVFEDRRSGLRSEARGVDILHQAVAMMAIGITRVEATPIATRGDRLALLGARFSVGDEGSSAYEASLLVVHEVDDHARIRRAFLFDEEKVDDAYAELEALYLAGEAAPYESVWRLLVEGMRDFNERAPVKDVVLVDHRPASFGTVPAPEFTGFIRSWVDLVPDVTVRTTSVHVLNEHGGVFQVRFSGATADEFATEGTVIGVIVVRDDQIRHIEMFGEDDVDAALARFAELTAS